MVGDLERPLTICRGGRRVASVPQDSLDELTYRGLIVDDQDTHRLRDESVPHEQCSWLEGRESGIGVTTAPLIPRKNPSPTACSYS